MHRINNWRSADVTYTIHGKTLETVNSSKYLGVHLQKYLNWITHFSAIVNKIVQGR